MNINSTDTILMLFFEYDHTDHKKRSAAHTTSKSMEGKPRLFFIR